MTSFCRKTSVKKQPGSRPPKTRSLLVLLTIASFQLSSIACKPLHSPQIAPAGLIVEAMPVEMDSEKSSPTRLGRLTFLSGFLLRSGDSRFGGLSGLAVTPDGSMLYAVSDAGYWVSARMRHEMDRRLVGFDRWTMASLLTPEGEAVNVRQRDAEALVLDRDGSLIVAFEQAHRLWRYPSPTGFIAPATPVAAPPELKKAPSNEGAEGLTVLPDGRLLVITEHFKNADGSVKGWLIDHERFDPLSYALSDDFLPTDVVALQSGDLLVLERSYTVFRGVAARIRQVDRETVQPGAVLRGQEVASFHAPLLVDNFEGIAARRTPNGETLVYIVSDDNYSPLQRTYVLQFRLEDDAGK